MWFGRDGGEAELYDGEEDVEAREEEEICCACAWGCCSMGACGGVDVVARESG
jgi:hypothetical protein